MIPTDEQIREKAKEIHPDIISVAGVISTDQEYCRWAFEKGAAWCRAFMAEEVAQQRAWREHNALLVERVANDRHMLKMTLEKIAENDAAYGKSFEIAREVLSKLD